MDTSTAASTAALGVIVVTLVVTGPLVAGSDGSTGSDLGGGDATVDAITLEGPLVVTDGRFGTGVAYLRIPSVTAQLSSISGRSRLVYTVVVPELGFERVGTRTLSPGSPGTVRVGMSDRAFRYAAVDRDAYRATVSVRIQSFSVDRIVYRQNVTVEVETSDGG